jgi:hypothetical protein
VPGQPKARINFQNSEQITEYGISKNRIYRLQYSKQTTEYTDFRTNNRTEHILEYTDFKTNIRTEYIESDQHA